MLIGKPILAQAPAENRESLPSTWSESYVISYPAQIPPKIKFYYPPTRFRCSCIEYAKAFLNRTGEVWGNAWDLKPNDTKPRIGSLVLFKNHVGVVVRIEDKITIVEGNYVPCKETYREIDFSDPSILGYRVP